MTSEERHEIRYLRRKETRLKHRMQRNEEIGNLDEVFTYHNMFMNGVKCCNGVRWKNSTQRFEMHLFSGTAKRWREVVNHTWEPKSCDKFSLYERGKLRKIDAPHINDRQIYKTLSKSILEPSYLPFIIYDNGASIKGKGLYFSYNRLIQQLHWHFRRYGTAGYVVNIDLKNFFPSAPRNAVYKQHKRYLLNGEIRDFADKVVQSFPGKDGMILGIEVSQLEMIALPSVVDNYIKCQLGVHCASHYMDDYILILPTKGQAKEVIDNITSKFTSMGLTVNAAKSQIQPLSHSFRFCKTKFQLTKNGKVVIHRCRDSMKRFMRKIKIFRKECADGVRTKQEIEQWVNSIKAYYRKSNDHGRILKIDRTYHAMFA